jgi:hypothetical protein
MTHSERVDIEDLITIKPDTWYRRLGPNEFEIRVRLGTTWGPVPDRRGNLHLGLKTDVGWLRAYAQTMHYFDCLREGDCLVLTVRRYHRCLVVIAKPRRVGRDQWS